MLKADKGSRGDLEKPRDVEGDARAATALMAVGTTGFEAEKTRDKMLKPRGKKTRVNQVVNSLPKGLMIIGPAEGIELEDEEGPGVGFEPAAAVDG